MDAEEWVVVKNSRRSFKNGRTRQNADLSQQERSSSMSQHEMIRKQQKLDHHLRQVCDSEFWKCVASALKRFTPTTTAPCDDEDDVHKFVEVHCIGLGSPTSHMESSYQLALLLCLQRHFNISSHSINVFDPMLNDDDEKFLSKAGVMSAAEKYENFTCNPHRLLVIPHCDKSVYGKAILDNLFPWPTRLNSLCMVGNNIHEYDSTILRNANTHNGSDPKVQYLEMIVDLLLPYATVCATPAFPECETAFNDLGVIFFESLPINTPEQITGVVKQIQ